jgi:hypothetical protein
MKKEKLNHSIISMTKRASQLYVCGLNIKGISQILGVTVDQTKACLRQASALNMVQSVKVAKPPNTL